MILTKEEKLMCQQMAKSNRSLFEKLLTEIKRKADADKVVKDTEYLTARSVSDAEARKKGAFELYQLIIEHAQID